MESLRIELGELAGRIEAEGLAAVDGVEALAEAVAADAPGTAAALESGQDPIVVRERAFFHASRVALALPRSEQRALLARLEGKVPIARAA